MGLFSTARMKSLLGGRQRGHASPPSTPVICVVSKRSRFIVLLVAKNASSCLRKEFNRPFYGGYEAYYRDLDLAVRERYFTVAPIREPVSRLLSAYQELSWRYDIGELPDAGRTFLRMDDTPERFQTFLSEIGDGQWDAHLRPQVTSLQDVRVDLFILHERLQDGIFDMCRHVDAERFPLLDLVRSRSLRRAIDGYDRFHLTPADLDDATLTRIRDIYADDVQLYEAQRSALAADSAGPPPSRSNTLKGDRSVADETDGAAKNAKKRDAALPGARREVPTPADIVPARGEGVSADTDRGGLTLWRRNGRHGLKLDEAGSAIWALCDGTRSIAGIQEALQRSFDVDDQAVARDVGRALRRLEAHDLLSYCDAPLTIKRRTLDLRQVPIYVINCKSDVERRRKIRRQLAGLRLRFEFVEGMECEPRAVGTAISHLRVLTRDDIATPFLVLEDDCCFNDRFRYEYELPADTDGYYLGVSSFGTREPGRLSWGKQHAVQWSRYDADNLRVYNMLAQHAIVYLSERFRQAVVESNMKALTYDEYMYPSDVGTAATHLSHLVLTPLKPVCYQRADLGGQQGATERALGEW